MVSEGYRNPENESLSPQNPQNIKKSALGHFCKWFRRERERERERGRGRDREREREREREGEIERERERERGRGW